MDGRCKIEVKAAGKDVAVLLRKSLAYMAIPSWHVSRTAMEL